MHKTISDLHEEWLASKSALSKHTLSTYTGEVARFEEFCLGRGVRRVEQLSLDLWVAYLAELCAGRSGTRSKRVEKLTERSARQAHRITRAFLTWLSEERRIEWHVPRLAPTELAAGKFGARANASHKATTLALHRPALPSVLTGTMTGGTSESDLRRQVAINLVFWGALKPSEVVALPVDSLSRARGGLTRVVLQGAQFPRFAPAHLWQAWVRYRQVRESRCGEKLDPQEPLLCTLHGAQALTPWTIWSMVRSLDVNFASSPRELRLEYLRRLTADASDELQAARDACGLQNLQPYMTVSASCSPDFRINEMLSRAAG